MGSKIRKCPAKQLLSDESPVVQNTRSAAHLAAMKAQELAEEGLSWATPRAEKAWRKTVLAAAPRITNASEKIRPLIDEAHDRLVDDYLPRISQAAHDAAIAASDKEKALTEKTRKHRVWKILGWITLGSAAVAAGYVLWRRTQPLEDPWAEEYWSDLDIEENLPFDETEPAAE